MGQTQIQCINYLLNNINEQYGNESGNNDDDEENEFDDGFDDEFDDEFGDNFSDEEEDLCSEGKLFQEGHSCQDVIQGKLGDCWFLGALAVLATQPLFLENIFFSGDPNQNVNQRWLDCGLWVCRFKKVYIYFLIYCNLYRISNIIM